MARTIAPESAQQPLLGKGTMGLNATARWKIGDVVTHCLVRSRHGRIEEVFTAPERNGIWVRVRWFDTDTTTEHPQANVDPGPVVKP